MGQSKWGDALDLPLPPPGCQSNSITRYCVNDDIPHIPEWPTTRSNKPPLPTVITTAFVSLTRSQLPTLSTSSPFHTSLYNHVILGLVVRRRAEGLARVSQRRHRGVTTAAADAREEGGASEQEDRRGDEEGQGERDDEQTMYVAR